MLYEIRTTGLIPGCGGGTVGRKTVDKMVQAKIDYDATDDPKERDRLAKKAFKLVQGAEPGDAAAANAELRRRGK
jgi:hypothetical protein